MRFVDVETGEGLAGWGEALFVVQIDLGTPSALVVEIEQVAVESLAAEIKIRLAVAHNLWAVKETQIYWGVLSVEMSRSRGAVRQNQWAEEEIPRHNRAVPED